MSQPIQITVGGGGDYDPGANATDFVIPSLDGKQFYVSRSGFGIMPYDTYNSLSGGGFRLLGGLKTSNGEVWFITITSSLTEAATTTSYSNGFNQSRVVNALIQRIGFRQPTISGYNIVDSDNQESSSGRFYDDFHSLVGARNIKDTLEDSLISNANFNTYLENLKKAIIMRCLNGVFNVPEQIERTLLYERYSNQDYQTIDNSGLFVGVEIKTPPTDDISVKVESVSLLFDTNATFNLYLFKEGKKTHIWSQSVTVVAQEATVVNLSDVILNYIAESTRGSRFFIGYFQDDLGGAKAIRETASWNKQYCFGAASTYSSKVSGQTNFERTNLPYTYDTFGINLEITTFRDHTNAVVKKAHLFDELQGLQMAYQVIEQIVYSARSNSGERILKDQLDKVGIQLDLNGVAPISDSPQITGLKQRIERELKRVKEAFYPSAKAQTVSLC